MIADPPPVLRSPSDSWKKTEPFGLPPGSVRAVLALIVSATIWALLAFRPAVEVPDSLRDLLFIILGHYFASRKRSSGDVASGPPPLWLPKGTIRLLLFAGFGGVAVLLARQGRLSTPSVNPGVVTLMLVAGFFLGVVAARLGEWLKEKGHRVPRPIEDLRAFVAVAAAVGLMLLVFNREFGWLIPRHPELFDGSRWTLGRYGPEHLCSAIIGFYFGSRS